MWMMCGALPVGRTEIGERVVQLTGTAIEDGHVSESGERSRRVGPPGAS
jgi:hypothetical protein